MKKAAAKKAKVGMKDLKPKKEVKGGAEPVGGRKPKPAQPVNN